MLLHLLIVTGIDSPLTEAASKRIFGRKKKTRQNVTKMTSFRGVMAKLGAGVDNELG